MTVWHVTDAQMRKTRWLTPAVHLAAALAPTRQAPWYRASAERTPPKSNLPVHQRTACTPPHLHPHRCAATADKHPGKTVTQLCFHTACRACASHASTYRGASACAPLALAARPGVQPQWAHIIELHHAVLVAIPPPLRRRLRHRHARGCTQPSKMLVMCVYVQQSLRRNGKGGVWGAV